MAEICPTCACAFCASLELLYDRDAKQPLQSRPCLRCGREWSDPADCYCLLLEEELVAT